MLDMKVIRENPEKVRERLLVRGVDFGEEIAQILAIDEKRRQLGTKADAMKAQRNAASKQVPILKKEGKDTEAIMAEMKTLADQIKEIDTQLSALEKEQETKMLNIPNMPDESVPAGADDSANVEVRKFGTPRTFDFTPKAHWDIGADLDILDPERAAKVTGARFHFYKGLGARLERAIINFYLDNHTENGYTEILPPFIANADTMRGTGQLPKFADDMFKLENMDYYLIPTAEVPVTNMYKKETLDGAALPIKHCAYSGCFRAEAGSAGRDTRGLIRQHQFNKVELVKFARPETSYDELESLTQDAEKMLQLLGLPYRVVQLCGGDLGFSSAKTYDIEVWLPSYGRYAEISSCSNFEDFQARRIGVRYKDNIKDKAQLVHTLNGSGLAIGRTTAAILENYQNADGTVTIPEALVPYMGGKALIK